MTSTPLSIWTKTLLKSRVQYSVPSQPCRTWKYIYKGVALQNRLGPAANSMALLSLSDRSRHAQKLHTLCSFWIWDSLDNCSSALPFPVHPLKKPGHLRSSDVWSVNVLDLSLTHAASVYLILSSGVEVQPSHQCCHSGTDCAPQVNYTAPAKCISTCNKTEEMFSEKVKAIQHLKQHD